MSEYKLTDKIERMLEDDGIRSVKVVFEDETGSEHSAVFDTETIEAAAIGKIDTLSDKEILDVIKEHVSAEDGTICAEIVEDHVAEEKVFVIYYEETYGGDFTVTAKNADEAITRFRETLSLSCDFGDYVSGEIEMQDSKIETSKVAAKQGFFQKINSIDLPKPSRFDD